MRVKTQTGTRKTDQERAQKIETTQHNTTNTKRTNNSNEKYPVALLDSWVVKAQTKLRKREEEEHEKFQHKQNSNDIHTRT